MSSPVAAVAAYDSSSSASSISTASSSSNYMSAESSVDATSRAYIMKVQHLIERCLTFYMDKEDCAKALVQHAGIDPIVTRTVWKELEKANQGFFDKYYTSERVVRKYSSSAREDEDENCATIILTHRHTSSSKLGSRS